MNSDGHVLEKEFLFTDRDFKYLSDLAKNRVGIDLPVTKRELVYSRLARRLRTLQLVSFKQYCALLESGAGEEFTHFINAITTNVTSFFRESHHFDYLSSHLFPKIVEENSANASPRLRIWSAGCSSGKEPYSVAMTLKESIPDLQRWDAKILATDLDSNILNIAKKGVYTNDELSGVSPERCQRWFRQGIGESSGNVKMCDDIRDLISFKQLNLMEQWPMSGQFDIILCRNVTIYFDNNTRINVINRFADKLYDSSHLFVGHSESLYGVSQRFEMVGRTIHKKTF